MKYYPVNYDFVIRVKDYMKTYPRPKHRSRFIINDGEILPIIGVKI